MTEDSDLFSDQDSTQDDTSSKKRTWKVEKGKNKEIIPSGILVVLLTMTCLTYSTLRMFSTSQNMPAHR